MVGVVVVVTVTARCVHWPTGIVAVDWKFVQAPLTFTPIAPDALTLTEKRLASLTSELPPPNMVCSPDLSSW